MIVAHGMNKKFYLNSVQLTFLVFLKEMINVLNFNPSFPIYQIITNKQTKKKKKK